MFERVIIWGHKLHTHTHSYIHYGFQRGFKHLNYDVYWFDNNDTTNDDFKNFNFDNCLFITEGQVDELIPIIIIVFIFYIIVILINIKI